MNRIEQRFMQYHEDNPQVYTIFKHMALKAINNGHTIYSAKTIMEVVRWHHDIQTRGEPFKVNNNYTAYYARKFMDDFPSYKGFFVTRDRKHLP